MITALIILAALVLGLAIATYISLHTAVLRHKNPPSLKGKIGKFSPADRLYKNEIDAGRKWIEAIPFSEEWITADDGKRLYGRFYRNGGSKTTILMMHGFRSNAIHDFSCAFQFYFDKGFNLFVPDQRAHGKSEGRFITYGIKERFDAKRWMEHINRLVPGGSIYATGVSMGATTVLMASELDIPENVKGIIADCGFTSPGEIIKKVMKEDMGVPCFPLYYTTRLAVRLFGGFDLEERSAVDAVKNSKIPILFLHGKSDGFVPFSMGEEIYGAVPGKKLAVWVEGADHGCSFLVDRNACADALTEFLGI